MFEDFIDDFRLGAPFDKRDDTHLRATVRAAHRINFVHALDQFRPARRLSKKVFVSCENSLEVGEDA